MAGTTQSSNRSKNFTSKIKTLKQAMFDSAKLSQVNIEDEMGFLPTWMDPLDPQNLKDAQLENFMATKFPGPWSPKEQFKQQINFEKAERKKALDAVNTFKINDPRKIRATTNQPMRPESDYVTGSYDPKVLTNIISYSKKYGVDPYTALAIGLSETQFGKQDKGNLGHVLYGPRFEDPEESLVVALQNNLNYAKKLGKKTEAAQLQAYQGYGPVYRTTESSYHHFNMDKIFGVPIPKTGLDMNKLNLKGIDLIDLRDNVLKKNPNVVELVNKTGQPPKPLPDMTSYGEGWKSINGVTRFTKAKGGLTNRNWVYPTNTGYPKMDKGGFTDAERDAQGLFTHQGDTPYEVVYNNGQYSSVPKGMSQHYYGETGIPGYGGCGPGHALDYNEKRELVCVPLKNTPGPAITPDYGRKPLDNTPTTVMASWDPFTEGQIVYGQGVEPLETNSYYPTADIRRAYRNVRIKPSSEPTRGIYKHRSGPSFFQRLGRTIRGAINRCLPGEKCPEFEDGGSTSSNIYYPYGTTVHRTLSGIPYQIIKDKNTGYESWQKPQEVGKNVDSGSGFNFELPKINAVNARPQGYLSHGPTISEVEGTSMPLPFGVGTYFGGKLNPNIEGNVDLYNLATQGMPYWQAKAGVNPSWKLNKGKSGTVNLSSGISVIGSPETKGLKSDFTNTLSYTLPNKVQGMAGGDYSFSPYAKGNINLNTGNSTISGGIQSRYDWANRKGHTDAGIGYGTSGPEGTIKFVRTFADGGPVTWSIVEDRPMAKSGGKIRGHRKYIGPRTYAYNNPTGMHEGPNMQRAVGNTGTQMEFGDGGYTFLQPTSPKLPQGYAGPVTIPSTELATSIGGEYGEPAYLVPGFKYGQLLKDPEAEFRKTGEHLGGPFKTWQEAEQFGKLRHKYVEKGQSIPTPIRTWGKEYADGGGIEPYYTSDPEDFKKRTEAYQDSLNLYKAYKYQYDTMKNHFPNVPNLKKGMSIGSGKNFNYNKPPQIYTYDKAMKDAQRFVDWTSQNADWGTQLKNKTAPKDILAIPDLFAFANKEDMRKFEKTDPIISSKYRKADAGDDSYAVAKYYESLPFNDKVHIAYHNSPDITHRTIRPVGSYFDGLATSPIYKAPRQKVIYVPKETKSVENKTVESKPDSTYTPISKPKKEVEYIWMPNGIKMPKTQFEDRYTRKVTEREFEKKAKGGKVTWQIID